MTKIKDAQRWLGYALSDGPLPAEAGRIAWVAHFHPHSDYLLDLARKRAGVTPQHQGVRPGRWWWRAAGDTRPISDTLVPMQCNTCHRVLTLPPTPRLCISTPNCRGVYQPAPNNPARNTALLSTSAISAGQRAAERLNVDLESWRFRGSPLRLGRSGAYRSFGGNVASGHPAFGDRRRVE